MVKWKYPIFLAFIILFSILAVLILRILFYSTLVGIPKDAIIVNTMNAPSFDGILEKDEWQKATHLTVNFTFENGETHPADIYLGHDNEALFVGAIVWHVGPNPYSFPDGWWFPDALVLYFDTDNDGKLTTPEDAKSALIVIGIENNREMIKDAWVLDWYWNDSRLSTAIHWFEKRPSLSTEAYWVLDDDRSSIVNIILKYLNNSIVGYNPLDGTQYFEFGFELNPQDITQDGLHVKPGELKVIGLAIEYYRQRGFNDTTPLGPEIYDDWPGDGYTPDVFANATKYAKIAIDLRKHASIFPIIKQCICSPFVFVLSLEEKHESASNSSTAAKKKLMAYLRTKTDN